MRYYSVTFRVRVWVVAESPDEAEEAARKRLTELVSPGLGFENLSVDIDEGDEV